MARSRHLDQLLQSAARLQELVPDAVLVGGSAVALHAGHGESFDHDHVLMQLDERYAQVLDAAEASDGWATSVRASRPPMTILGSLDGIAASLGNMRRNRPLETIRVEVAPSQFVTAPTAEESLRVKAYLVVQRWASGATEEPAAAFLSLAIERVRQRADAAERAEVARRVREAIDQSGATAAEFALHVGTSASRLST